MGWPLWAISVLLALLSTHHASGQADHRPFGDDNKGFKQHKDWQDDQLVSFSSPWGRVLQQEVHVRPRSQMYKMHFAQCMQVSLSLSGCITSKLAKLLDVDSKRGRQASNKRADDRRCCRESQRLHQLLPRAALCHSPWLSFL